MADADEFVRIRLGSEHALRYISESNRGLIHSEGEVLEVRKSLLTLVEDSEVEDLL